MWCYLQDLRRSNFTAADCRDCNFKNTKLQGTYFIKTVVARANFEVGCGNAGLLTCICASLILGGAALQEPLASGCAVLIPSLGMLRCRMRTSQMF